MKWSAAAALVALTAVAAGIDTPASPEADLPGRIVPSGIRPSFAGRLEDLGYDLSASLFEDAKAERR